ncbi:MAG: 1-acyl-sn-glycerol-3-phosphate acyltransferase [Gammaproteobacteria bacterium]|nr:1-acyl-sn-glycerol-3-phosphate acyltransferase [Gammaproteobacteria bacterium]MCP4089747.1 1-acyl-sn-glycerol-3-phosphate acyltransferase [Gammaproteobacteria bacterium]MCP4831955.1 1-acyl-sn-glycerol-3-phosphate acyltransferase [Gammaproteobacteria bacterium]
MSDKPKFLQKIGYMLYGARFLFVWAFLWLSLICMVAVTPGEHRRRRIARKLGIYAFHLSGAWPTIIGLHQLPKNAAIVVANHASYLDGPLLAAVLPHRFQFVIKREISQIKLLSFVLHRTGEHFVDRFDPKRGTSGTRRILKTATNGASLAFFPEGTFRLEPGLRRFQNGAFTIAARNNMLLVPLTIRGTRKMLPQGSWLPRPAQLEIIIGTPLDTTENQDLAIAMEHCRMQILQAMDEPDLLEKK